MFFSCWKKKPQGFPWSQCAGPCFCILGWSVFRALFKGHPVVSYPDICPGPIRKPGSRVFPSSTNPAEFSLAPAGPNDIYCKAIIRALCVKGLGQGLENKWIYTLCSLVCHARLALSLSIGMCLFLLSSAFCLISIHGGVFSKKKKNVFCKSLMNSNCKCYRLRVRLRGNCVVCL